MQTRNCVKAEMCRKGWENVKAGMLAATGKAWSTKTLSEKLKALQKDWQLWKKLKNKTGGGLDPKYGVINAPSHWWKEAEQDWGEGVRHFKNKPLWFEDEMDIIFCESAGETGNLVWPGSSAAPGGAGDDEPDAEEDVFGTQPAGSRRAGKQRDGVDSPSPKKQKKSYGDHQLKSLVDTLSESVRLRSSSSQGAHDAMMGLISQLQEDGLCKGTDEYWHILDVLKDEGNRTILMSCSGPDARMSWVRN